MTLAVVTYWWQPDEGSAFHRYDADDVRLLQRQVARHLPIPHEFVVVTDQPEAFADDEDIRAVPIDWTTHIPGTCYVRLFTFSPQAKQILGERILQLDLDSIVVADLTPIVGRDEDLVLWRNPRKWVLTFPEVGYAKALSWFNGAVLLHSPGTRAEIWQNFRKTWTYARDDQWLISDFAGKDNPYWDESHGIYRSAPRRKPWLGFRGSLPENARLVTFVGGYKPWNPEVIAENPWIEEFRR